MVEAFRRHFLTFALAGAALLGARAALAQPVIDRALSDTQLVVEKGCAILKINFNFRIRYASHFPLDRGEQLWITVNAVEHNQATALMMMRREGTVVANGNLAAIKAIDLETQNLSGPVLKILFDHPVAFQVAPDPDVHSMVVAIAGAKPSPTCKPIFPQSADAMLPIGEMRGPSADTTLRPKNRAPGAISDADLRAVAAWMDEGRAALKHNNIGGAIQLFTKVLKYPENQYSADAQEMLGVAYQKSGRLNEASAEYEDYLRRYPSGETSERVKQRLAGIVTASGGATELLHTPNGQPVGMPPTGSFAPVKETTWSLVGSASQFYIRDDGFNTVRDPSIAPDPLAEPDSHQIHQNQMLSTLDLTAIWNNDQTKGKIRFSGSNQYSLVDSTDLAGVAALSVDTLVKDWNLRSVVGRQILNTDGVLGRFDGALFSWQALPEVRVDLVGGSPVISRYDLPFKDEKYFYGAGIGLGPFLGGFQTTLYAIQQRDRELIDRESVGADLRYFDQDKFAYGNVDYDVYFNRLNDAVFSGSWTLPDRSTIFGGADYRRTPFLSTWNALLNQPFTTLYDMLRVQNLTSDQLQQLAIDQTPIYKSAMIGFSHPLTDRLQVSADATIVNLTQTITPFGLDPSLASLPSGNDYYFSAQLIGTNFIKEGDMYTAGVHYSQSGTSDIYMIDFNSRFPITNDLRISPRLRFGYTTGVGSDLKEYTVLPSILVDYLLTKDLSLEAEIGVQWTDSIQSGVRSTDTELMGTIGVRYDFYPDTSSKPGDDKIKCGMPGANPLCRYTTRPGNGQ